MGKAIVVYTTRTGETKDIADLIAEGIRMSGAEAEVVNSTKINKEDELCHLPRSDDARDENTAFPG